MNILDHLGQAAAVLLLVELLVVVLIFAGIAGGLAFGLRWVQGKTHFAFEKAQLALSLAEKYTDRGLKVAAEPVIRASGFAEMLRAAVSVIESKIRTRYPNS